MQKQVKMLSMKLRNIFIFCITIILGGCNIANKSDYGASEVIKVNPSEAKDFVNLSEIADSVVCIKLQTDSLDVLGKVREIVIREKYIYAQDVLQQSVFVFDKSGKFISKLAKRGKGPDEYVWMGPIYIDEEEQYIDVIDKGPSLLKRYTIPDFQLLHESSIVNVSCNSSRRKDSFYYFATQQIDNVINDRKTNAGLITWDDQMQQVKCFFDKEIETNHSSFCPNIESFTQNRRGELFISMMYDHTFYQIEKDRIIPVCTVDFCNYNIDNSVGDMSLEEQMNYIKEKSQRVFFPVLTMNDENIVAFSYYFKKESDRFFRKGDFRQYIKFKNSDKVIHAEKIKNDLTSFPSHVFVSSYFGDCAHEVWYNDYLVDIVLPSSYFEDGDVDRVSVEGVGEITIEDNPVIVMIKLKKVLSENVSNTSYL